jgi:alkylhydroperoxidase family enzyme
VRYDVARQDGLTEARAELIDDHYVDSALAEREKLAIALADCYLRYPAHVPAELAARLLAEFTQAQILSTLIALMSFNFTSRTAVSLGGMPEEPLPVTVIPVSAVSD